MDIWRDLGLLSRGGLQFGMVSHAYSMKTKEVRLTTPCLFGLLTSEFLICCYFIYVIFKENTELKITLLLKQEYLSFSTLCTVLSPVIAHSLLPLPAALTN